MYNKLTLVFTIMTLLFTISCKSTPTDSENAAPTASFTINPTEGTTLTAFTFDASGSSDDEDETSGLKVRWDWNNDGTYDTDYSTTKTATHQFIVAGTYTVVLEVEDSEYLTNATSKTVNVSTANTAPTASFTISPAFGTVDTVFDFDASGSSDNEDATTVLQVRWDWDNDGTYDTNYNTTKTTTQQYTLEGIYTVKLQVRDSEGWMHSTTKIVTVQRPSTVVTFSDANFEALLRVKLNKQSGDITDLDLENITALNGGGWNISDISGIEYCINLQNLNLRNNQINDIGSLDGLEHLQTLSLLNNQISDISALGSLLNLQILGLSGNQIIDIGSLGGLTNLNLLYLDNNQIINIISLSTLINLKELGLADNQIVDIYPLIQNNGIDDGDNVTLSGNPLSTTSVNTYIPQLEARGVNVTYDGGGATVVTFSDANFEGLIRSTLSKPTGDITVTDMETITTLNGSGWNISDISEIIYCTNLQSLNLENNQLTDISDLSGLTNLDWLDLSNNQIIDIYALTQNGGIGSGDTVYLNNNPLNTTSVNTYIPQLEARGVTVYH